MLDNIQDLKAVLRYVVERAADPNVETPDSRADTNRVHIAAQNPLDYREGIDDDLSKRESQASLSLTHLSAYQR